MSDEQKTPPPEGATPDPHARMVEAWAQGARVATEAMQRMIEASAQAAAASTNTLQNAASTSSLSAAESATQPQQAMEGLMAGLGQAFSRLSSLQTHFLKSLLEGLPETSKRNLDAQCFSPLERLSEAMAVKLRYGAEYYADPDKTPVGQTPRECVHTEGKISLYRYLPPPDAPPRRGDPVLLVYSVINKSYILDLVPGFGFVEHLLDAGLDIYLVDWGPTEPGDRSTTLDGYIDPGLTGCIAAIRERTGAERVSLFGHCIGGNLALMLAALRPEEVGRLVTLTTPITASEGGVVSVWTDRAVLPMEAILRGETRIHGQKVDLKAIRCPVMNLAASRDWIVSPESAEVLGELVGSEDYRYVSIEGAHVTIMIDPRAKPIWGQMSDFLLGEEPPGRGAP